MASPSSATASIPEPRPGRPCATLLHPPPLRRTEKPPLAFRLSCYPQIVSFTVHMNRFLQIVLLTSLASVFTSHARDDYEESSLECAKSANFLAPADSAAARK